jgi:hypothetical protein
LVDSSNGALDGADSIVPSSFRRLL